ncbi:MAG TPA: ATP phosphoribosyltransferase [Dehalococcoidia bacterium]|jgi:ATP phosphoribosyltransferase|nr:ATP phosphoribosyltransferase [Dehalococcoidia bacterium]
MVMLLQWRKLVNNQSTNPTDSNLILTLVVPSDGELHKNTLAFLEACGLKVNSSNARQYTGTIPSLPGVSVLFQRTADITSKIEDFSADVGITGLDRYLEYKTDDRYVSELITDLGYGYCDFVIATPETWLDVNSLEDLSELSAEYRKKGLDLRIATKYPKLLNSYLYDNGVFNYRIVTVSGALEAAPAAGYADLIADLSATGSTLRANNLKPLIRGRVLRSQSCLIGNPVSVNSNQHKITLTKHLIDLMQAYLRAEDFYRITANVKTESENELAGKILEKTELSGIEGPTISKLYTTGGEAQTWFSISVLVSRTQLLDTVDHIRKCGGSTIAVSKIDYLFNSGFSDSETLFRAK